MDLDEWMLENGDAHTGRGTVRDEELQCEDWIDECEEWIDECESE
jgi:hypothetical protein